MLLVQNIQVKIYLYQLQHICFHLNLQMHEVVSILIWIPSSPTSIPVHVRPTISIADWLSTTNESAGDS